MAVTRLGVPPRPGRLTVPLDVTHHHAGSYACGNGSHVACVVRACAVGTPCGKAS